MKKLRRALAAFLLLAALLTMLCACAQKEAPAYDGAQLEGILDEIAAAAGKESLSALDRVRLASELLIWAKKTELSKQETAGVVGSWLKKQTPEIKAWASSTLSQLGIRAKELLQEGSSDLLKKAGLDDDVSQWSAAAKDSISALLDSLQEAAQP